MTKERTEKSYRLVVSYNSAEYDSGGYYYKCRIKVTEKIAKDFLAETSTNVYKIEGNKVFLTLTGARAFVGFAVRHRLNLDVSRLNKEGMNYYLFVEGVK